MFRTQFLTNEADGLKQFQQLNVFELSSKRITPQLRRSTFQEISSSTPYTLGFKVTKGGVVLPLVNHIYCMEHVPHNCDLVLPKANNINEWIVLFYEQTTLAFNVTKEAGQRQTFKIYSSDKQRIMGLDEPLVCDMPFMSLRMIFLGDIDGWVVS